LKVRLCCVLPEPEKRLRVSYEALLVNLMEGVRGLRGFELEIPHVLWDVGELEGRVRNMVCGPR